MENQRLWEKLTQHKIAGSQHQLFVKKLVRENNWRKKYCLDVIEEYKRFCYLAALRQTPVSPSHNVDKVWHLHLTFSKSYWQSFCPNILGAELHHEPADSGFASESKMKAQYLKTLDMYKIEFGEQPPENIWTLVSETPTKFSRAIWWGLLAMLAGGAVTAYAAGEGDKVDWLEVGFWFFIVFVILKFFFNRFDGKGKKGGKGKKSRKKRNDHSGSNCTSCNSCSSCGGD